MRKFLPLVVVFGWSLVFSSVALAYQDYLWVYRDPGYTQQARAFDDGETVYVKVTDYITQSTPASVTVTNINIGNSIEVLLSDSGAPTVYKGEFIIHSGLHESGKLRMLNGHTAIIVADLDNDGEAVSAEIIALYIPSPPRNLQAVAVAEDKVKLTWNASDPEDTVAKYNVYRSTSSGGQDYTTPIISVSVGPASYELIDSGLVPGNTYYYTVRAEDRGGDESVSSNEASTKVKQALLFYRTESTIVRSSSPVNIVFSTSEQASVSIKILNLVGEIVKEETISTFAATETEWTWDGKNMHNTTVNNGVYILVLEAVAGDGEKEIKRRIIGVLY